MIIIVEEDVYCPYSGAGYYLAGFTNDFRNHPQTGEPIVKCLDNNCPYHTGGNHDI